MNLDATEILIITEMSKCSKDGLRLDCAEMSLDKTNHVLCEIETYVIMRDLFGPFEAVDFDPMERWGV
jgi:hypothetical protein